MLRHLIWDFDGTLFDTYPAMTQAYRQALQNRGLDAPYDEIYSYFRQSVPIAFAHYREALGADEVIEQDYARIRKEIEIGVCAPYSGMEELLRDLNGSGRSNYIFTHRGSTIFGMLDRFGWRDLFREIVTAEAGFARKPEPDGILYLIQKYGMDKDECAMIGDRELDVASGNNAGVHSIGYFDGTGEPIRTAETLVGSVEELRAYLLG